jgi:hypothetical protein
MPIIAEFGRLRHKDQDFKANLGYLVRPCQKKKKERTRRRNQNNQPIKL